MTEFEQTLGQNVERSGQTHRRRRDQRLRQEHAGPTDRHDPRDTLCRVGWAVLGGAMDAGRARGVPGSGRGGAGGADLGRGRKLRWRPARDLGQGRDDPVAGLSLSHRFLAGTRPDHPADDASGAALGGESRVAAAIVPESAIDPGLGRQDLLPPKTRVSRALRPTRERPFAARSLPASARG